MRIIVAGSRDFTDYSLLTTQLDQLFAQHTYSKGTFEIVSGGATGADSLGEKYAREFNIRLKVFPADWINLNHPDAIIRTGKYGKYDARAGMRRNKQMADYASLDNGILVAFWDKKSPGTKSMIDLARKAGLGVIVVDYTSTTSESKRFPESSGILRNFSGTFRSPIENFLKIFSKGQFIPITYCNYLIISIMAQLHRKQTSVFRNIFKFFLCLFPYIFIDTVPMKFAR